MKHPKTFLFVMISPLIAAWIIGMNLEGSEALVALFLGFLMALFADTYV